MASDSWRYPWTMLPDYMGPGTPVEQYEKNRAALVTNVPAKTANAVSVATSTKADAPAPTSPVKAYDANMPNGSIKVVTQDSGYPNLEGGTNSGAPRAQAPNIQFATLPQMGGGESGGGGGAGLFSPGLSSQLSDLYARSNALLSSKSMVDNWRGRQLAKMHSRLMLSEAAMGNTRVGAANAQANMLGSQASALRAANEVPLAMMGDYTHQRGQDITQDVAKMHDATQRYGIDSTAGTQRNATDALRQIHASDILRAQQQQKGIEAGDLGAVEDTTHAFSAGYPRVTPTGQFHIDPATGMGVHMPPGGGLPQFYTQKQMADEAKKPRQKAMAGALYGDK